MVFFRDFGKNAKKNLIILLLFSFCSLSTGAFAASDDPVWSEQKRILGTKAPCIEKWKALWAGAKSGDIDARVMLYDLVAPGIYRPPGWEGDFVAVQRQGFILLMYTEGNQNHDKDILKIYEPIIDQFKVNNIYQGFTACLRQNGVSAACTKIGVDEGAIPSFTDFSKRIDIFTDSGLTAVCAPLRRPEVDKVKLPNK